MALPQQIVRDLGGTIDVYPTVRAGASPLVRVRTGADSNVVDSTAATLDAVSTTLNGAVTKGTGNGSAGIILTSTTGIVAGRRYRIGPADPDTGAEMPEIVRVAQVTSATVVRLLRPLLYDHATAIPFVGTRLSYVVTAAQAASLFWDGNARWLWTGLTRPIYTGVECVLRPLERLCTATDLYDLDGWVHQALTEQDDPETALEAAFEAVVQKLGATFRARTLIGSDALILPTVHRLGWRLALQARDTDRADTYDRLLGQELDEIRSTRPADLDQDNSVEENEGPFTSGRVDRA